MTARIDHSVLVPGPELKDGARSRVLLLSEPRDVHGGQLVYKRYHAGQGFDAAVLDALGELPHRAGPDAVWLGERTAWPQMLVTDGAEADAPVVGFLMRAAPADFHFSQVSSSGTAHMPAEFTFLLNDDRLLADLGLLVSDRDRLLLLADVADALGRLHRLGVCVGDLSPKNLLFAPSTHRAFFLDCDSMRLDGALALRPTHTPGWELPDGEEPATGVADVYKFGLLATRIVGRDPEGRDPSRLGHLSGSLAALAAAALDRDPRRRPPIDAWVAELKTAAGTASTEPPAATMKVPVVDAPMAGTPTGSAPVPNAPDAPIASAPSTPPPMPAPVEPPAWLMLNTPAGSPPEPPTHMPLTVPAAEIVGSRSAAPAWTPGAASGPTGPSTPPPAEAWPQTQPQPQSRKRVNPYLIVGAAVLLVGGAAGAAAAAGVFKSDSGNAASTTIGSSGPATTATSPNPTTPGSTTSNPTPTSPEASTPATTSSTAPPAPPATSIVGVVQIDQALVADPRAVQVATLFDTFFAAVTAKRFDDALALYDPTGDVNTNDPAKRAAFKKSESTSTDDNGLLKTLTPAGPGPVTTAVITFRSQQSAGFGPGDDPRQTCSIWTLTYTLSYSNGKYSIKAASGSHTGC